MLIDIDIVTAIIWAVSFVLVTVTVTGFAGRAGWSAPVALVAVGGVVSFIPGVPGITVEPDLVLYGILPPLLFAAAIRTPLKDILARRDSILVLSVGLVAFTVVAVGFSLWWLVPSVGLAAAFAFGAVVAPTDAVAVTAIAGKLRLPRRVVTVLESESLLNDATALVALNASIAAIVSVLHPWDVVGEFGIAVVGGVAVGFAVGFVVSAIRKRLRAPVLDTSLSLVIPYVAFIPAQLLGGSGVLAVVIAGLFLGQRSPQVQTAEARIAESINWRTIRFLLENAVFLFIGLSLAGILDSVRDSDFGVWQIVGISAVVLGILVVSRFAFVGVTTLLYEYGPGFLRRRAWGWRTSIAVSAAGIRGVVTLAAVFLLPTGTPQRELLQFLAFVVVAGTLLEGLALPAVIRRLKLPPPNAMQERTEKHNLLAEAQTAGLATLDQAVTDADDDAVVTRLRVNAEFLSRAIEQAGPDDAEPSPAAYNRLRRLMIDAEREAVLAARSEGRYQERAVRDVLRSIDAEETALAAHRPKDD
ncbi:CPA1 family monovalent cation:H+ antiporter [Conyzicola lurida]|uniref:CPA1 family monovalent cation:H+ antiporter n=1 Tax=Conyzicola lurida TaxID=1172621 RepID=A0A841AQK2_9MICO|nr:CPA1 family monovalent cation:H+ antiporter [Conyzicola lurida]